jgi:NAD(P)H-dependent nitrite reductase small subunit
MSWQDVCSIDDLQPNSGVCALVDGQQVAIFYLPSSDDCRDAGGRAPTVGALSDAGAVAEECYAINNYDPFGNANVISRGVIGDINDQPVVASPLYKQHFNLQTGVCLEDETVKIPVYGIRINNNRVEINVQESGNEL